MSKTFTAAYVAGFFDGEGCVLINRDKRHNSYSVQVSIGNTDRRLLDAMQQKFGGNVYEAKRFVNRPMFYWQAMSNKALAFIRWIRPHLLVKAQQAWLALEFTALRGHRAGRGYHLTDEQLAVREGFYLALQNAKRG